MSKEELEQKIKEKRSIEANKKNLVGQNGKIGIVLKTLGQPIISQNQGEYFETNYLDLEEKESQDPTNSQELLQHIPIVGSGEENERPRSTEWTEMPEPESGYTQTIGWHFDGLSRGMHLEIKYDNFTSEMNVHYKGYPVYTESKGDIDCYVPIEEWENWIDHLYKISKKQQREKREKEIIEKEKESKKNKSLWFEKIKEKWGIE